MSLDNTYNFRNKDPIIDIMRTLIQCRADIEGIRFSKICQAIERETKGNVKATTLYGWFSGPTKWPQYRMVTRVILNLQRYARKPVMIGDRDVRVMPGVVRRRVA